MMIIEKVPNMMRPQNLVNFLLFQTVQNYQGQSEAEKMLIF